MQNEVNAMQKVKKVIWILIALIIIYLLASLLAPLYMFTIEDKLLADQLNNKYIDNGFEGWKTVSLPEFRDFKIPGNWELSAESDVYVITDEHNSIIAYGGFISENNQKFATSRDFLQEITSFDITDYAFEYDPEFVIINLSEFGVLSIQGKSAQIHHAFIKIYDDSSEIILFVFPESTDSEYNALLEIAQAVVYSSYYQ